MGLGLDRENHVSERERGNKIKRQIAKRIKIVGSIVNKPREKEKMAA